MSSPPSTGDWDGGAPSDLGAANPISVSDLATLPVSVHWAEAVAIVEEVCALLVGEDAAGQWVPDSRDVFITAHGTVMLGRGAEGSNDIDELGRMLHALLDPAATPMPIRLFIAQSIGSGKFTTVSAYAEALAYYGRPGRTELIQALYLRCLELPDPEQAPPAEKAPEQEPPPAAAPKPVVRPKRTWTKVAAVAFVSAGLATMAVWMIGLDADVSASMSVIRQAVSSAATATVQQVAQLAPSASPPSAPPESTPAAKSSRPSPRRQTERAGNASVSRNRTPVVVAAPQLSQSAPVLPTPTIEGGLATAPPVPPAVPATLPSIPAVLDAAVYSSATQDVEPPVMRYPQLPPVPPITPDAPGANTMELLVDERGTVQEVKLKSRAERLTDMSLLSAAKTWKFSPALKDGRPVKYRLEVSWVVTPP
jgi:protein TonB